MQESVDNILRNYGEVILKSKQIDMFVNGVSVEFVDANTVPTETDVSG